MKTKIKTLRWLRKLGIAEGISFLVLLFIAMPLKYFAEMPEAVKIVGWMHGVLFIIFMVLAFEIKNLLSKNFIWFVKAFTAAILPFGTFVFDKALRKEESQLYRA